MAMQDGEWYVIQRGVHQGKWHLAGWMEGALDGGEGLAYAHCPVCHAMICADGDSSYGDQTWAHEQWHARTDHPIPVSGHPSRIPAT